MHVYVLQLKEFCKIETWFHADHIYENLIVLTEACESLPCAYLPSPAKTKILIPLMETLSNYTMLPLPAFAGKITLFHFVWGKCYDRQPCPLVNTSLLGFNRWICQALWAFVLVRLLTIETNIRVTSTNVPIEDLLLRSCMSYYVCRAYKTTPDYIVLCETYWCHCYHTTTCFVI